MVLAQVIANTKTFTKMKKIMLLIALAMSMASMAQISVQVIPGESARDRFFSNTVYLRTECNNGDTTYTIGVQSSCAFELTTILLQMGNRTEAIKAMEDMIELNGDEQYVMIGSWKAEMYKHSFSFIVDDEYGLYCLSKRTIKKMLKHLKRQ